MAEALRFRQKMLSLPQRLLGPLALGDVPEDSHEQAFAAQRHWRGADIREEDAAILLLQPQIDRKRGLPLHVSLKFLDGVGQVLFAKNVRHAQIKQLVLAVAEHPADRSIGRAELPAFGFRQQDAVRSSVKD